MTPVTTDPETVDAARERDGAPDPDRPDHIDDALEGGEQLGKGVGEPLAADTYGDYPRTPSALASPDRSPWVRSLFEHPVVNGWDDAVQECTSTDRRPTLRQWREALENAADAAGINAGECFEHGRDDAENDGEEPIKAVLGFEPHGDLDADNPILVAEMYLAGLGTGEIAEIAGTPERTVRETLIRQGLIGGKTNAERRDAFEENQGRLGGTSLDFSETADSNPSVDVDMGAVEESEGVTVNGR